MEPLPFFQEYPVLGKIVGALAGIFLFYKMVEEKK